MRAAGVRHVVYVSSASVTYPRRTAYAESKLAAEAIVAGSGGFQHTIVRPTLVYDRGGGQELMMFLAYLRRFPVVPLIGAGTAIKRPVWADDVVDGLARLAGNEVAYGRTYNLSGSEPISMLELSRLLLSQEGMVKPFVRIPVPLCRAIAGVLSLCVTEPPLTASAIAGVVNDADLDPTLAMRDLGYRPIGVREGIPRCFAREPPVSAAARTAVQGAYDEAV